MVPPCRNQQTKRKIMKGYTLYKAYSLYIYVNCPDEAPSESWQPVCYEEFCASAESDEAKPDQLEYCSFLKGSDIVPDEWDTFWDVISESAPFSWGDNNRTLVTLQDFLDHAEKCLIFDPDYKHEEIEEWVEYWRKLSGDIYVDLEN